MRVTGAIKFNTIIVFINQLREDWCHVWFSETATGNAQVLPVRLDIRRIGSIKKAVRFSVTERVKVVKNKVTPPFRQVEFDIFYGKGISKVGEVIDLATENKIVSQSWSGTPMAKPVSDKAAITQSSM